MTNAPVDHDALPPSQPAEEKESTGGAPRRQSRTARDMVLSLVVLLIPIVVIIVLVGAPGGNDPVVTDPGPVIAEAQSARAFPVAVPTGLSSDWKSVSSAYDANTLRIGYVTPAGAGVQLIESSVPKDQLLIQELGDDTKPDGVVPAGSGSWNAYQVRNGQRALVLPQSGRTIIVIGDADPSELAQLAASVS